MAQTPAVWGSRGEQEGCGAAQVGQRKASRGAAAASSLWSIAENSSAAAGPRQRLIYNRADASPPLIWLAGKALGTPTAAPSPRKRFPARAGAQHVHGAGGGGSLSRILSRDSRSTTVQKGDRSI